MSQNVTGFAWNTQRELAARLVADDQIPDEDIAKQVGVTRRQLGRWKLHPYFQTRVGEHVELQRESLKHQGIANKQNRIEAYNDRWRRLQAVIGARADELAEVPGGATGLLVRTAKLVKVYNSGGEDEDGEQLYSAKRDVLVYEYAVDTAVLKELRETEKQAAMEMGQWTEKSEVTGDVLIRQYVGVPVDDV